MPDMVPAFKGWRPPNPAISSIGGNLRGHDVYMADLILVRNKLTRAIKKLLIEYKPALIGLSAMSFQFDTARRIATFIKAELVTNLDDYRNYNGFWANVRTKYLVSEELQFIKWKYKKKYSAFFKTTPSFKSRFLLVYLLRLLLLRPYYRAKNTIRSLGKTEKEVFLGEMSHFNHLNDFGELNT